MRGVGQAPAAGAIDRLSAGTTPAPPVVPARMRPARVRLLYVDWLRLLVIAGVFVIHVCSVFDPWDEWHIVNAERSRIAGETIVLMAPWIMPLMMLLAGVSAWYSLERRSNGAYVRERVVRVFVPLVAGTLLLVPPQVYLERRLQGAFTGSLWAFYPHFFEGIYPRGNFSWHHLWFLGHLFAYSLITLPLLRYWQRPNGRAQLRWIAEKCRGPGGLLWLALPLMLERQLLWGLFPERHMLTSDWSNHALLFVAYLYGFMLAGEPELGKAIDAQWLGAFGTACLTTTILIIATWLNIVPARLPEPYDVRYLAFWTVYAIGAWAAMVAVLGAARRWLRRETPALRYGRDKGYGWYIMHQPIIIAVAYVVVRWRASIPIELAVLLIVSLVSTLAAAELLQRTPLVRQLFGFQSYAGGAPRMPDAVPQ